MMFGRNHRSPGLVLHPSHQHHVHDFQVISLHHLREAIRRHDHQDEGDHDQWATAVELLGGWHDTVRKNAASEP